LKYVSRVVFKGGILGGACQFWGNPYLNSTTVLFDKLAKQVYKQLHEVNSFMVSFLTVVHKKTTVSVLNFTE